MHKPGSLFHFLNYAKKDTGNKVVLGFTGVCLIFVLGMYLVDFRLSSISWSYVKTWKSAALFLGSILLAIWIAITIYTVVKYRKYLKTGR
jgi:hypothetical protein